MKHLAYICREALFEYLVCHHEHPQDMCRWPQTEKFIPTRSKAKALSLAEGAGIAHPIATKVQGGFVCYSAY